MKMRAGVLCAVAALGIVAALPALATEERNDVGVVVGYVGPSSDSTIEGAKTEADNAVDYGVAYKHKFLESKRLSVGGNLLFTSFDVKADGVKAGDIDNMLFLLDANWHFLANKNLYAGVTAGYSNWGDFEPEGGGGNTSIKSDVVYGVNVGYDIPIGKRFAILTNLRYLGMKAESDDTSGSDDTVDVNPIIANVGFAWRF
ncbi:MAG TPA: OmpW family outer membrane protein [Candidatus Polarisedimenticolaceae bacterium]|nr:OmpW family outer membrane protein [Candidatus Polarisedimenticolaceae bacterium]